MLIHSFMYYELDDPIISDEVWQARADELADLQLTNPGPIGWYDQEFAGWDGSTGCHLPRDSWVAQKVAFIKATAERRNQKPMTQPMQLLGLDIETKSTVGDHPEYALQPWRLLDGEVKITHIGIADEKGRSKEITLDEIEALGKDYHLVTYNGVFDVAFLHAAGVPVDKLRWVDAMMWWKWVDNGQQAERIPAWSLADGVERWLTDLPWVDAFLRMKAQEDRDDAYWADRAKLDAFATVLIARRAFNYLTAQQRRSVMIESMCIAPVAKSWVRGVRMDVANASAAAPRIKHEMSQIEQSLELLTPADDGTWQPSKILRSPKQLREVLYETWGLPVDKAHLTDTGLPGTSKKALTYLADIDDRALEILAWRKLNTTLTKFIQSPSKAAAYLGSNTLHPSPKLFATYTGRMTYGSKIQKKYPIGMALHQIPREKDIRKNVRPPIGHYLVQFDAAGQESRIMADKSQDPAMLHVFNQPPPNDDLHSFTGASLAGTSFERFLEMKAADNKLATGPQGFRYQGKFTNLSFQFRIGAPTFRIKTRVDYGMAVDYLKAKSFLDTAKRIYKGVPKYWKTAIRVGKELGYAETRAGRRFKLSYWSKDSRWSTEQSSINFPIQGTGGDMKELALAVMTQKHPEFEFGFDLHDALFMYIKKENLSKELIESAKHTLNNLPYREAWGWEPSIPIPWDCSIGEDWGSMRDV